MKKKVLIAVLVPILKIWVRHLKNPAFKYDGMTKMETLVSDYNFTRWTWEMTAEYRRIHAPRERKVCV